MTTIAYRNGVLASDSKESDVDEHNNGHICDMKSKKIYRLRDGRLFGGKGASEDIERVLRALKAGHAMPVCEDTCCILIETNGKVSLFEGHIWVPQKTKYIAIGSGAAWALAAMDHGKGAIDAVKYAITRDWWSGGRVQVLRVGRK